MKKTGPSLRFVFTTSILLHVLGLLQAATAVEIVVDAGEVQEEISPDVFGSAVIYSGWSMGYNPWVDSQRDYEEAKRAWNYPLPYLSELGPVVLRYPHGLGANEFHWKAGIGPIEQRDPNYDGRGIPQTFGTDEFLQYCEELGAGAILVVNVSVAGLRPGTVENAADWVEYCNAPNDGSNPGGGTDWAAMRASNGHPEPYGVKYWELGNEEIFPGWESYAQRVREYSQAMKAVDSTIKVGAIRTGAGLDAVYQRDQWLAYQTFMLENAGEAFDFWTHHTYPPGSSGFVNGFEMSKNGTSVSVDFQVERGGIHRVQIPVEGGCSLSQCPSLELTIDGEQRGTWVVRDLLGLLDTPGFPLEAGQHRLRLEVNGVTTTNRIIVCNQIFLFSEGDEDPSRIDLKNSDEFYRAYMGGWSIPGDSLVVSKPYAGGKPVFFTEANSQYSPTGPYHPKACALREMLGVACLYHVFLRQGVPLVNYWYLFEEPTGVGVLEGVAYDGTAQESLRLDPHRRPVFHLLKAYRHNAFDYLVSTNVLDSPRFLTGLQTGITMGYAQKDLDLAYVQALATLSASGDDSSLFVVNLHPQEDIHAQIQIAAFKPKSRCQVLTITGASPGANNEPEDCPSGDCVTTTERVLDLPQGEISYLLPRHSVTIFVLHREGSDQEPPRNPTGLSGSTGDGKAMLFWDSNREQDLGGYFLYRSRCPEGPFRHRVNVAPIQANEYLDANLGNEVTYTYAVTAVDRNGNESGFSDKIRLTPLSGSGDPDDPPVGGDDQMPPSPPILLEVR